MRKDVTQRNLRFLDHRALRVRAETTALPPATWERPENRLTTVLGLGYTAGATPGFGRLARRNPSRLAWLAIEVAPAVYRERVERSFRPLRGRAVDAAYTRAP